METITEKSSLESNMKQDEEELHKLNEELLYFTNERFETIGQIPDAIAAIMNTYYSVRRLLNLPLKEIQLGKRSA